MLDAIVIGSGPNGLAAAITLARAGHSVRVYEAESTIGGGIRSAGLTQPGFTHDVCAAVHAVFRFSPFLKTLPLAEHGLDLVYPSAPFAHPLDDGSAIVVHHSIDETVEQFSNRDARAYKALIEPFANRIDDLMNAVLSPFGFRQPLLMARFGRYAIRSAGALARSCFTDGRVHAMLAGAAAHSMIPLDFALTAGYALGLILTAHAGGWPVARGGSQFVANALASYLRSLGGEIVTDMRIDSLESLPASRAVLCDITPRQFIRLAGPTLPTSYRRKLERYRYGPGVFKMDWALSAPVPWLASGARHAGTLHLGGSMSEVAFGESESWRGRVADRPYVLAVQPTIVDTSRAPEGKHTLWAYCHVPHGSTVDMQGRIEAQVERFAPGFRDCIIARSKLFPADLERRNANLVGGDIAGGATDFAQFFARPVASVNPYRTALPNVYICSSSTPPGVGVHGMCGFHAAQRVLQSWS